MKKSMITMAMAVACVFTFMAGSSQAAFTGYIYEGDSSAAFNPSLGPTIALTSTFTVDKLNFDSQIGGTTYDGFLGGPGNVNNLSGLSASLVGKTIVTATDPAQPSYTPSTSIYGTLFKFTGTAYFPANIEIRHDDGFWLQLGNTVYDSSTPIYLGDTVLNNPAGVYSFTLNYGAYNGFPEVLVVPTSPVPIPAGVWLLGSGLIGLIVMRRRFRK